MVRDLSYFCSPCMMEDWEECQNEVHVLSWCLIKLKSGNSRLVRKEMEEFEDLEEWDFGGDEKELSDLLQTFDNFAMLVY